MAKEKEVKTNAMRMLDKLKLPYKVHLYECDEFIDGVHIAELLGESCDSCFKTLVTVGKSGNYYVFALPVDKELDMKKCARAVGEKSLEMVHVKDINAVTGYIRGGCTFQEAESVDQISVSQRQISHRQACSCGAG